MAKRRIKEKKIRLGFLGLGRIFNLGYVNWLGNWLKLKNDVELVGVSDIDVNLCNKYHKQYKVEFFEDPIELLKSGINAVVISSPNWAHEEQVIAAAANGVHVLCEKPMAPTSEACGRMNAACAEAGVFLQISFMRRFCPAMQKIKRMTDRGELGELVELNCEWPYYLVDIDRNPYSMILSAAARITGRDLAKEWGAWRLKDPRCGGGDFLDHGPHVCDLFTWFAGRITHVSGESRVMVDGRNEDFTCCRLKFANGAFGSVTTTLYDFASGLAGKVHGFIRGTKGRVDFIMPDTNFFRPNYLIHYNEPKTDVGKIIRAIGIVSGREERFGKTELFRDQLEYFVSTILGKRKTHVFFGDEDYAATGADGEYTIKIVEKAYESSNNAPSWMAID